MKLTQKGFLSGSREFEIIEDAVLVQLNGLFKKEKLTVGLSTLNPEPIDNGTDLVFHSNFNNKPALSLLLGKPNSEVFNAFVDELKQKIVNINHVQREKTREDSQPEALGWNVYDEPPAFDEQKDALKKIDFQPVRADRVNSDINMLKTYMDEGEIKELIIALEALKAEPENETTFNKVVDAYNELGFNQGAVLTYAPYLKVLLTPSNW